MSNNWHYHLFLPPRTVSPALLGKVVAIALTLGFTDEPVAGWPYCGVSEDGLDELTFTSLPDAVSQVGSHGGILSLWHRQPVFDIGLSVLRAIPSHSPESDPNAMGGTRRYDRINCSLSAHHFDDTPHPISIDQILRHLFEQCIYRLPVLFEQCIYRLPVLYGVVTSEELIDLLIEELGMDVYRLVDPKNGMLGWMNYWHNSLADPNRLADLRELGAKIRRSDDGINAQFGATAYGASIDNLVSVNEAWQRLVCTVSLA